VTEIVWLSAKWSVKVDVLASTSSWWTSENERPAKSTGIVTIATNDRNRFQRAFGCGR